MYVFSSHTKEIIGILSGGISLVAYLPYIYSIFQGKTKPSRSSWWIWSLVGLVILLSYYSAGARNTIWVPAVFFVCPLIVAILSIKYGANSKFDWLDIISIVLTTSSLIIWSFFRLAIITLSFNIFLDFIGFLPTFRKSYHEPSSENKFTWILFFLGSILNLIALEKYSFSIGLYPIYMFVMDLIMISLLFIKPAHILKH